MERDDFILLMPFIIMAASIVTVMLAIAVRRHHGLTVWLTLSGLAAAAASLPFAAALTPRMVTSLFIVDKFALFYSGLIFAGTFAVVGLSYAYNKVRSGDHEEYYLLLLTASLGAAVLAASVHFASFFLGFEILSVSLYALSAYHRHNERSIEAGVKYLILAAVSSSFILFGMALMYAETGSMEFPALAAGAQSLPFLAGIVLVTVGIGFKLAVVPFHMWTPDVYEGAPAPVAAFIATVSKGAVFALALRFFPESGLLPGHPLFVLFTIMAVASMFVGNLLALFQKNVKRILAYSSISHLGYLLVTLLVAGPARISAASFYLAAYFVTTLGVFGVVTVLSGRDRDADSFEYFAGLAWRRPWLAAALTGMLFSLAGIPLTAGFIAKFSVAAAGVNSSLWLLVVMLVVNSIIGIFYYLRIVAAVYSAPAGGGVREQKVFLSGGAVIFALSVLLLWLGIYPGPVLAVIQTIMQGIPAAR